MSDLEKQLVKQRPRNLTGKGGFKAGKSGNPKGRPKKTVAIADMLRSLGANPIDAWWLKKLQEKYGPTHHPKNYLEAAMLATLCEASRGDSEARKFLAERTEGKVADILRDETPTRVIFEEVALGEQTKVAPTPAVVIKRTIIRPGEQA